MALWVDKYRPRELSKLDYHVGQANDLKRLCEQQDFPHLMFFGPSGAGIYKYLVQELVFIFLDITRR